MLSEEQIEKYHTDGYLAIEGVLSDHELSDLRRVTDEFFEKSRALTESDSIYDLGPDHSAETPLLRRISHPINQHPVYDAMILHKGILDRVEQLIGPDIGQNGSKLNFKLPEQGSPVQWHQDWAFYPHTNDDLLAVGIAIDDMTLENDCLMVIPGSPTEWLFYWGRNRTRFYGRRVSARANKSGWDQYPSRPFITWIGSEYFQHVAAPVIISVLRLMPGPFSTQIRRVMNCGRI